MDEQKKDFHNVRKILLIIVSILVVSAGVFYIFFSRTDNNSDKIVAKVGEEVITQHEVETRIRQIIVSSKKGGLTVPEDALFDSSLDDLITESLLFQDALKQGFFIDPKVVDARYEYAEKEYERIQKESGLTQTFLGRMAENLMTPEDFRRNIGRQMVLFAYLEDLKRKETDKALNKVLNEGNNGDNVRIEVASERTQVTSDDIARISKERADQLKVEYPIKVYLKK